MPRRFKPADHLEEHRSAPSYLNDLPSPTDADFWRRIERQLTSAVECLGMQAIQTEEEAAGKFVRSSDGGKHQWTDGTVHYAALPYINGLDNEYLAEQFETIRVLYDAIRTDISERRITPEFLWRWGALNSAVGAIEAYSRLESRADGHKRAGLSRDRTESTRRKVWFSHYIIRIQTEVQRKNGKRVSRSDANRIFARLVHRLAYEGAVVEDHDPEATKELRDWCKAFVNKQDMVAPDWSEALKPTFRKHISKAKIEELNRSDKRNLPELKLKIPKI